MKLILCVVCDDDADQVIHNLIEQGFYVTRLASTGGFLRMGTTVLLSGVEDERVDTLLKIVQASTDVHVQPPPSHLRMEQAIRRAVTGVLAGATGVTLTGSVVDVTLLNPRGATVHVTAYTLGDALPAPDLARHIAESVETTAGFRAAVTVDVMPRQACSTL